MLEVEPTGQRPWLLAREVAETALKQTLALTPLRSIH